MILPKRRFLSHETPEWVKPGAVFFLTDCCEVRGLDQLCRKDIADALFEAIEFRQRKQDWYVHLFLLMPDHWHGLVSFPRKEGMKKVLSNFKEITAKKTGVVWQRDFFDHRLRNHESFEEKAHYIRMNPVRKGLVTAREGWPWVWTPAAASPAVPPYHGTENSAGPAVPPYQVENGGLSGRVLSQTRNGGPAGRVLPRR